MDQPTLTGSEQDALEFARRIREHFQADDVTTCRHGVSGQSTAHPAHSVMAVAVLLFGKLPEMR